ncbi:MAG: T9SS type A sorting domain-containing protein, partial [Bacteroidota bacterium]
GTHTITYEVTDGACTASEITEITVSDYYDATIDDPGTFCYSDPAQDLTAATTGGTWSGTGITDQSAGTFDPGTAGNGTHTISYEVTSGECTASDQIDLYVSDGYDATIDPVSDLCETDDPVTLTAADAGGTWSGTGITDESAGTFDPATAGQGDFTVSYEISGSCGDYDEITIHVDAMPNATIDDPGDFCAGDAAVTLTAAESGGTWSGPGVSGDSFDPAVAGIGSHTITYEITDGACTDTDEIIIDVAGEFDATIDPVNDLCESDDAITLTAADEGGTWAGPGVSGDQFNPGIAGPGDHAITYTFTGACGDSDEITIHVDEMPDATINDPGTFCISDDPVTLTAATPGGTWSGYGVTGNQFDPAFAGVGGHLISYELQNETCSDVDDIVISVGAAPDINVSVTDATTSDSNDGAATATASGGLSPYEYYWSNGDTDATMEDVPSGNYSVMVTDAAGCVATAPVYIDFMNNIANNNTFSFKVYPNPTENLVYIKTNNLHTSTIELVNMLGQTVKTKQIQSDIEPCDVTNLKPGVYFVRIITDNNQYVKKLMIE